MRSFFKCNGIWLAIAARAVVAVSAIGSAASVWAQAAPDPCQLYLGYEPLAVTPSTDVSSVPGLTISSVCLLALLLGIVGWRFGGGKSSRKILSALLLAGISIAFLTGQDSVVRAAGPYELSDASGGILINTQVPYSSPSPLITVKNSSGKRMRITTNGNPAETGTCIVGFELAPGATCTTEAVCSGGGGGNN